MRQQYLKEAIELFDDGDTRSFNELYEGKEDLFTDVDDLINPKFRKLFEATYQAGNIQQKRTLREDKPKEERKHCKKCGTKCGGDCDTDNREHGEKMKEDYNVTYGGDQWCAELSNKNDGVPSGHNKPGLSGADPQATQGQGRGTSSNAPLSRAYESQQRFFEDVFKAGAIDNNPNAGPTPSGDGVPEGHNRAGMSGEDTQTTMGQGRGDSNNAHLFNK